MRVAADEGCRKIIAYETIDTSDSSHAGFPI